MPKPVIICVDDEKTVLTGLKHELEFGLGDRYSIEIAESAEEALELLAELLAAGHQVPVLITDQLMPGMKGDELIVRVHSLQPQMLKILLTGQASADAVGHALNQGSLYRYVAKPWEQNDLRLTVDGAAKRYFAERELNARVQLLRHINDNLRALNQLHDVQALSEAFLSTMLSQTGATLGVLCVFGEGNDWDTHCKNTTTGIQLSQGIPPDAPTAILHHVRQVGQGLYVDNAMQDAKWCADETVRARSIASFCCLPIVKHFNLIALLYLERADVVGHFDAMRQEFLNLSLGQAATTFDNALLHTQLEHRLHTRTQEVAEKSHEIANSLRYASRIQEALLPHISQLQHWLPQSFAWLQPQGIISSDFYWLHEGPDVLYLATLDATNMGVPAAFAAVLANTVLNALVRDQQLHDPAEILFALDLKMREALRRHTHMRQAEHFDVALVQYDRQGAVPMLHYAGANTALAHYRAGQLTYWPPTELRIGAAAIGSHNPFTSRSLTLQSGDNVYICTDGLALQQDADGQVLGADAVLALLQQASALPAAQQQPHLHAAWQAHRGTAPQTDDLLVLGLCIP